MSGKVVVCYGSATDAADFIRSLQTQEPLPQCPEKNVDNNKEKKALNSPDKKKNNDTSTGTQVDCSEPDTGSQPHSAPKKRPLSIPATDSQRPGKKPKAAKVKDISPIPVMDGIGMIGDSILLRMLRKAARMNVPSNIPLCQGGNTAETLKEKVTMHSTPKQCAILVGTNDLLQGTSRYAIGPLIYDMIQILKKKGTTKIYLCEVPPVGKHSTLNECILHVNRDLREIAERDICIRFVELYRLFCDTTAKPAQDLFETFYHSGRKDLIHPNKVGLEMILQEIKKAMYRSPMSKVQKVD